MRYRPVLFSLFALLGGCSLTGIGPEHRAHREQAALHKLLDGQKSYSFVVQTMSKRDGLSSNETATEFLADRASAIENDLVVDMSIDVYQACN